MEIFPCIDNGSKLTIFKIMCNYENEICEHIARQYPELYEKRNNLPLAYHGSKNIKVIVLGTDPTYISGKSNFEYVFDLGEKNTPFFRAILENLKMLDLNLSDTYVQNLIRNYFKLETCKNPKWKECSFLWMGLIKRELDKKFYRSIPILVTAWKILDVVTGKSVLKKYTAQSLYENNRFFNEYENYFGRTIIPFFRHYKYRLKKWPEYSNMIKNFIDKV